ncbi:MAG: hypothetical protein M3N21_01960 [Actinomycetota bacterium]|nr:hypothetical protein [Actinomycetota bacterium]
MALERREKIYYSLRGGAAAAFICSAVVLPRGPIAAVLCLSSGVVAVLTCIGTNAGGPGERAGAQAEARRREPARAPSGDWPPFDPAMVVDGEVVPNPRTG